MSDVSPESPVFVAIDIPEYLAAHGGRSINTNGGSAFADPPFRLFVELCLAESRLHFRLVHQGCADRFALLHEVDLAHRREACARRDEVTHNDVLLEAAQAVDLAECRCFGEDARGVLEARCADEAVGFE